MCNLEKYDSAFIETFQAAADQLGQLKYQAIPSWDSVGHMQLMATLEEKFAIEMDVEDIIEFSSYSVGKTILAKYGVEIS